MASSGDNDTRDDALQDDFLATLSHELRSPLSAVLNWCQMLRSGRLDAEQTGHALETIERNARLQVRLIDDILDLARLADGKVALEPQTVDPDATLEDAARAARAAADAKQVTITIERGGATGTLVTDPERLQQIVARLFENAIKTTPSGGRITARVEHGQDRVRILVTDTGNGIAAEVLPYAFDRFRHADPSSPRRQRGLGLGLAIARTLVEALGGTITATSEGEGKGSTITVDLPRGSPATVASARTGDATDGAPVAGQVGAPAAPTSDLHGVRVVIIDDDPDALELMRTILSEHGADIVTAGSALEAFDVLQQGRPDVLISDIGMPDADGYALLRKIRAPDTGERGMVPAIAVTGHVTPGDRQRALSAGYQMHLAKPFDAAELVAAVTHLSGRG